MKQNAFLRHFLTQYSFNGLNT